MLRFLGGLIMALAITHSTPSDASFSAAGAAAWTASHTITGLAAVATSGAYGDLSGSPVLAAVATSGAYSSLSGTPALAAVATSGAYSSLSGTPVLAAVATSGAYSSLSGTPTIITLSQVYPVGSVYIETIGVNPATTFGFGTWAAKGRGQVLVGFKTADTAFGTAGNTGGATGLGYTPSGTNAVVQFTPAGTNAVSLFREAAAGTNAASVVTGSVSADWPTGVPTETAVTLSASVTWPTGVPSFAGTSHRHELPIIHTDNTVLRFLPTATFGVGSTSRVPDLRATVTSVLIPDVTSSGVALMSNTVTAAGIISWPASVPLANCSVGHSHIISWPASVPPAVAKSLTAAAQVFTGVTGSVSAQVFAGTTGTVSGQVFTGVSKTLDIMNPYIVVFFWERTA